MRSLPVLLMTLSLAARVAAQSSGAKAPPTIPAATIDRLIVGGAVLSPLALNLEDLSKMPRTTVKVSEDGVDITYEGVLLAEILKRAGAPVGAKLRGKALASYLLCEAQDGYRVVFALAEFDPDFSDNPIIVADKREGKALFDYQGPFRVIAPRDKRAARGIRKLTRLTVAQVPE